MPENERENFNLVYRDALGNDTARGRQPGYSREPGNPPLAVGSVVNLPFGDEGEDFRPAGYLFVVEEIRPDTEPHRTLVIRGQPD
jgi:hypothetical protein